VGRSLRWTPALRPYSGPVGLPRKRKAIGRCVRCVLVTCRVKEGLSRSEQLVGYFYSAPPSRRGLLSGLALTGAVHYTNQHQPSLSASTHAGVAGRINTARSRCLQRAQFIEDTVEPSFSCPGLSSCSSCA